MSAGLPVALVTGANKGIGLAVAAGLAAKNISVLLGARDQARGDAAADRLAQTGVTVTPFLIDIANASSVESAANRIEETFGRLDILVNNAAVKHEFHPCPPSRMDLDVVRDTYETNVFGTMRVMQAMLPLLRISDHPRVVNVSSGLGSLTMATTVGSVYQGVPLLGYNTAKAALNSLTVQFANELRDTPFKINVADPGYTRTDMTANDGTRTPEQAAQIIIELALLDANGPTGGYFDERGPVPW